MKSKLITLGFSLLLLSFVFSFNSCKKEKSDSDTSSALDNFIAENESYRIEDAVNSAASDSGVKRLEQGQYSVLPSCAHVLIDLISPTKSITIDFGTTGCVSSGWDGKTRKGVIQATWTGKYRDSLTVITFTTTNYFVDGTRYDYKKTVTNNGKNSAGHLTYTVDVSLAHIVFADGKTIDWTSTRTNEWIEGEGTPNISLDDVYSITGNAQATGRDGQHFTANIVNPLIVAVGCPWIEKGSIEITPDGKPARTIDYGNGACDRQATVEIKGVVYNISL